MAIRVTLFIVLGVSMLLTQTSCAPGASQVGKAIDVVAAAAAKPATKASPRKNPRTTVYVGDDVTVVRHAGRTYIKPRDDDNGDGIPDED